MEVGNPHVNSEVVNSLKHSLPQFRDCQKKYKELNLLCDLTKRDYETNQEGIASLCISRWGRSKDILDVKLEPY